MIETIVKFGNIWLTQCLERNISFHLRTMHPIKKQFFCSSLFARTLEQVTGNVCLVHVLHY